MSESLTAAADVLRAEIRSDARSCARALTAFAERFAIDPELRDAALILNIEEAEADSAGHDGTLEGEMLALVDRIIEDHTRRGGEEAVKERSRTYGRMREHLLRKAPPEELVFEASESRRPFPVRTSC